MGSRLRRLAQVRWDGFAHTSHWLQGVALTDYLLREHYAAHLALELSRPSSLLEHVEHLAEHRRFWNG